MSLEVCIMKYKWDCMSDEKNGTKNELSDIALDVLLKNLYTEREYEEMKKKSI